MCENKMEEKVRCTFIYNTRIVWNVWFRVLAFFNFNIWWALTTRKCVCFIGYVACINKVKSWIKSILLKVRRLKGKTRVAMAGRQGWPWYCDIYDHIIIVNIIIFNAKVCVLPATWHSTITSFNLITDCTFLKLCIINLLLFMWGLIFRPHVQTLNFIPPVIKVQAANR